MFEKPLKHSTGKHRRPSRQAHLVYQLFACALYCLIIVWTIINLYWPDYTNKV